MGHPGLHGEHDRPPAAPPHRPPSDLTGPRRARRARAPETLTLVDLDYDSNTTLLVRAAVDLVNTHPAVAGAEGLADERALEVFLRAHRDTYALPIDAADLRAVRRLRTRLRRVFALAEPASVVAVLNELLRQSKAQPQLTGHDGEALHFHYTEATAPLVHRMTAEAAIALSEVVRDRGIEVLRTCEASGCQRVFVDMSRNRSRRYCSPETCGNRTNVAAYRARQRELDAPRASDGSGPDRARSPEVHSGGPVGSPPRRTPHLPLGA